MPGFEPSSPMTEECRKAQERAMADGPFGDLISDHDKCPYRVQLSEHSILICSCGCHGRARR